jgi:hypothetical protein
MPSANSTKAPVHPAQPGQVASDGLPLSPGCHVEVGPIDDPTVYEVIAITEAEVRICIFMPSQRQLKRWASFAKEERSNFPAFRALMMRNVRVVQPEWFEAVEGRVVVQGPIGSMQLALSPKRHLLSWIFSMGDR